MIRPEDVTDAMVDAAMRAMVDAAEVPSDLDMHSAIAAAINASGCVLVPLTHKNGMTPGRVRYFMERFKREEKLLGPNEQCAVDYVIDLLAAADPREQALDRMAENAQGDACKHGTPLRWECEKCTAAGQGEG